jgi:hypothetical protein
MPVTTNTSFDLDRYSYELQIINVASKESYDNYIQGNQVEEYSTSSEDFLDSIESSTEDDENFSSFLDNNSDLVIRYYEDIRSNDTPIINNDFVFSETPDCLHYYYGEYRSLLQLRYYSLKDNLKFVADLSLEIFKHDV